MNNAKDIKALAEYVLMIDDWDYLRTQYPDTLSGEAAASIEFRAKWSLKPEVIVSKYLRVTRRYSAVLMAKEILKCSN